MSTEWEQNFSFLLVPLSRDISDHTPLLLNTRELTSSRGQTSFKFELGWLLRDGFSEIVKKVRSRETVGSTSMEWWQSKIRKLHQYLRGWAKNVSGVYKKREEGTSR